MKSLTREIEALLTAFAERKDVSESASGRVVDDRRRQAHSKLRAVQAERIRTFVEHFGTKKRRVAVLGDPVGTGKTCVSLFVARLLMERHDFKHVVVLTPNKTVAKKWFKEAENLCEFRDRLRSGDTDFTWGKWTPGRMRVITRNNLRDKTRPNSCPEQTLFIVDEAHRGTQTAGGEFRKRLAHVAKGARVLLVTATPMQLSASGLVTMLGIGSVASDGAGEYPHITNYGLALNELLKATHADSLATNGGSSERSRSLAERAQKAREKAQAAFTSVQLGQAYPRKEAGVPPHPVLPRHEVTLTDHFATAYHVASCIPELIGVKRGDMFNRMLVSSAGAFWDSEVGGRFKKSAEHEALSDFGSALGSRLDEHAKVRATVDWIRSRPTTKHVIVFCIFKATQTALRDSLVAAFGESCVKAPDNAEALEKSKDGKLTSERFRRPAKAPRERVILVVRDNLSESIDLDGGQPAVVHHDLSWNPVRLHQRMGRVCRAGSGFIPIPLEDIYVPVMPIEIDERLAATAAARTTHADVLLPRGHDEASPNADEDTHDSMWSLPQELLDVVLGVSPADQVTQATR